MTHPPESEGWLLRADRELLVSLPSRLRSVAEITIVLAIALGSAVEVLPSWVAAPLVLLETIAVLALLRPWARGPGSIAARWLVAAMGVFIVLTPAIVQQPSFTSSRRLGIQIVKGVERPGDPPVSGGIVDVTSVVPGSPADGILHSGDRVVALADEPLAKGDAVADLVDRVQNPSLPEDTTVTLIRDSSLRKLPVQVPQARSLLGRTASRWLWPVRRFAQRHLVIATALRDLLFIAFTLALARRDGQPFAALGIVRQGVGREVLMAAPLALGTFAVQMASSVPMALLGRALGVLQQETAQRTQVLRHVTGQGTGPELVVSLVVAALFEEIAFRAFLTPRLRALTGSWAIAIVLASVAFGLGHAYEGVLAMAQTALLGAYFGCAYLWRRRVWSVGLAHAAFNIVMLGLVWGLARWGLLERMGPPPH